MAMAEQPRAPEVTSSSNEEGMAQKATIYAKEFLPNFSGPQAAPKRPSSEEMIAYYSKKGLDKQAATEKVIDDLQKALTIAVSRYPRKAQEVEKSVRSVSGTLDSLSNRLSAVEAKVDGKPDLGGVFMAGVAAGGFLQAVPHVFGAFSEIGRSLKNAVSSKP